MVTWVATWVSLKALLLYKAIRNLKKALLNTSYTFIPLGTLSWLTGKQILAD